MRIGDQRLEFSPPPTPGLMRAALLALLAHGVLLAVLALGVQWKREPPPVTVAAELWSAMPQDLPSPTTTKQRETPAAAPFATTISRPKSAPSIATAWEKNKEMANKRLPQGTPNAKVLEKLRLENLNRMADLAESGRSSAANHSDTSAQSFAPTASYMGRIAARIKPNIVYIEPVVGNLKTEIEVRISLDGSIISSRIVKVSGTKSWDDAALKAIDKTGTLPKDENGRVPSPLIIVMSPQELFKN